MEKDSIIVIFDGECRFCRACVGWLKLKVQVSEFAYQDIDTTIYALTKEQCSKEVHIQLLGKMMAGAPAVSALLKARGNKISASLISGTGSLGHIGYRWVASHRNSWIIKSTTRILEKKLRDN